MNAELAKGTVFGVPKNVRRWKGVVGDLGGR